MTIFDTATISKLLRETRLANKLAEIYRAYRPNGIENISWLRLNQNVVSDHTRANRSDILRSAMLTGKLLFKIEQ